LGIVRNRNFPDVLKAIIYLRRSLVMELNSQLKCMEFQGQKDRNSISFILRLAQVKHTKTLHVDGNKEIKQWNT
jgi:hypothetical protein